MVALAERYMSLALELVDELWAASTPASLCPHLAHDDQGCLCRSPGCDDDSRRAAVDHLSLPVWGLDAERFDQCLFYGAGE
jgi:hypothetical protein